MRVPVAPTALHFFANDANDDRQPQRGDDDEAQDPTAADTCSADGWRPKRSEATWRRASLRFGLRVNRRSTTGGGQKKAEASSRANVYFARRDSTDFGMSVTSLYETMHLRSC